MKRIRRGNYALVVESSNPVYRFGEVWGRFDKYLIVDHSSTDGPKVSATFDFQQNEFIDENLWVWKFGEKFHDPIIRLRVRADSYPKWAEGWRHMNLLAREHEG